MVSKGVAAGEEDMSIDIDEVIERALEPAFAKALEQIVQRKAETLFQKAFANGCPLARKLESKIEAGLQRFFEEGIRWEKKTPGFKN